MTLDEFLAPEFTFCNVPAGSKKRLLENSAEMIAEKLENVDPGQIFEALIAREQLGSTGIGNGIAIPHCRIPRLQQTLGCLFKLKTPADFDAIDGAPVDILFFLLVPENTIKGHLEALKTIAENFGNAEYCRLLRAAETDAELYSAATRTPGTRT